VGVAVTRHAIGGLMAASATGEPAPAEEPTQASIVALLRELADGPPAAGESEPPVEEQEFPWRWSERSGPGAEPELRSRPSAGRPASVAYLLPGLPPEGSGGSHSLVQEVRGLRDLGARARICVPVDSLGTAAALYGNEDDLFATYRSDPGSPGVSDSSLRDAVADAGVVVATEYPSVELLARLAAERPDLLAAYYVQDYEPLFAAARSARSDRALLSYRAIPGALLFAKTHWLRNVVSEMHGVPVAKVRPSLDRELFHARGRQESEHVLRVAAMIRPRTPRRRPLATLDSLSAIYEALGETAQIVTFGCDEESFAGLRRHAVPGIAHLGLLSRGDVAELMRRCDVFIDASAYQAFGRTGLEAMACGAVPLLPALGGVREYAVDGENAVILADAGAEAIAAAVLALARDPARLGAMRRAGAPAAQGFTVERAATSQLALFEAAVRHPPPTAAAPVS
jgi:glycosyltransferase involved in cell wall biosynthesis